MTEAKPKINILEEAKKLRAADPKKYGVHGTKKGQEGHVENGWKQAVSDAGAKFGKPKAPKRLKHQKLQGHQRHQRHQGSQGRRNRHRMILEI